MSGIPSTNATIKLTTAI
jgi:hypothetical protein